MRTPLEFGWRLFANACASCHSMDGTPGVGPTLQGVLNRPVASVPGFAYSRAMREAGGDWDMQHLRDFVADPQAVMPGTRMAQTGVHYHEFGYLDHFFSHEQQRYEASR